MSLEAAYYETVDIFEERHLASPYERARLDLILGMIPDDATSVLDVGTGRGHFIGLVEARRPELFALGAERAGAAIARRACRRAIVRASADRLPFRNGAFDVVTSLQVIEHLPYRVYEAALAELVRVARRTVVIDVPYREKRLMATCPYCGTRFSPHFHMRTFDRRRMLGLLPGLRIDRMKVLRRNESILAVASRPFRASVFGGFPDTICPTCGYGSDRVAQAAPAGATHVPKGGRFARLARRLTDAAPTIPVPLEVVVRYRKDVGP